MNERIKELRKQAINFCLDKGSQGNLSEEVSAKFAELIVKECAGIYSKIDNGNLHMGTDDYLEALHRTFFGVKE